MPRVVTKKVYYCDHCKKKGFHRSRIEEHEKVCTMNPRRECGLCRLRLECGEGGCDFDLQIAVNSFLDWVRHRARAYEWVSRKTPEIMEVLGSYKFASFYDIDAPEPEIVRELNRLANDCPACALAIVRQSKTKFYFPYKEQAQSFIDDYREVY